MIKLIKSSFHQEKNTKKQLINFIANTEILSMSQECLKFENDFSSKQQRKYSVFVNSGSSANLILIQALLNLGHLKLGDKVGFSALTWATNVMPIIQLGLTPVPIDCELSTLNTSPNLLTSKLKGLKAFFITNTLGFCDNIIKIAQICKTNNIIFLEDNCESLGSKVKDKLLGNFGLASTFSTFVGHHLSTIEGGMICTDDKDLHQMLIMCRAHGWDRSLPSDTQQKLRKKHQINDFFAKYTFYELAYNVRPTEINGFLGQIQLKYWDEIVEKRAENFHIFQTKINKNPDIIPFELSHMSLISNFAVPIICKNQKIFQHYKEKFEKAQVEIRPIIAGSMVKQPFYTKYAKSQVNSCPNAEFIHENGFYFGNTPEYTKKEIQILANLL